MCVLFNYSRIDPFYLDACIIYIDCTYECMFEIERCPNINIFKNSLIQWKWLKFISLIPKSYSHDFKSKFKNLEISIVLMARYLSKAGHPIMSYFICLAFSWHPANKNSDTIIWLLWIRMRDFIMWRIQYLYKGNELLKQVTLDRSTELSRARNWRGRGDFLCRNSSYLYSR